MSGPGHPVRRVKCHVCGARRYNRCRNTAGAPVSWHHTDRIMLADLPAIGRRPQPLPREVRELLAEGWSTREVERRTGVSRDRMYRHGVIVAGDKAPRRPGVGRHKRDLPAEVEQWIADGMPMREVARRSGIHRSVLYERGHRARPRGGAAARPTAHEHPHSGPPPADGGAPTAPTT